MPSRKPNDAVAPWAPLVVSIAGDQLAPFVLATIQVESNGNAFALNTKSGAAGLMQIIPSVYKSCGIKPYAAEENVKCGVDLINTIRRTLNKVDPGRFNLVGYPDDFERRAIAAGFVKGWSLKAGVARDLKVYRGDSWDTFLGTFPEWKATEPYVSIVSDLSDKWRESLPGMLVSEIDNKPSLEPGPMPKKNGKVLLTLMLSFFLSLTYILASNCDRIAIIFK